MYTKFQFLLSKCGRITSYIKKGEFDIGKAYFCYWHT